MKTFTYTIRDEQGIHARPAGILVKEAQKYKSSIEIIAGEKRAAATKLIAIMSMGVKCGHTIRVEISGPDEEETFAGMQKFFEENF